MIIAELNTEKMEVRFSAPNELFGKNPFIRVNSKEDATRKMIFKNRKYIISTMSKWLRQRKVANPSAEKEITYLLNWVQENQYRGLYHICLLISRKKINFQNVAPAESSTCYKYYKSTIIPILEFCTGESINDNTQS